MPWKRPFASTTLEAGSSHSVGFPHLWSGTEMYLAAAFIYGIGGCPAGERIGEALCAG